MTHSRQFYIDGQWVDPSPGSSTRAVINPATEATVTTISMGTPADVDAAVRAARKALDTYSQTTRAERLALLQKIITVYQTRQADFAEAICSEMGAPKWMAQGLQYQSGLFHLNEMIQVLKDYPFEERHGTTLIHRDPVGVCGLITPWNWPINQVMCKVVPALAAGCTIVAKPSEYTPTAAMILAEIFDAAGLPPGVFNLVNGDGLGVGAALTAHPGVDMISFTGSTRAGIQIMQSAAGTVKKLALELGGKSANLIAEDADWKTAVAAGTAHCMFNSGQACDAPSRMLVHESVYEEALGIAAQAANAMKVGDPAPFDESVYLGPVANENQWKRVQDYIETGIREGAHVMAGGPGRPEGLDKGWYVRPTIFGHVRNDMRIAQEEIFGPVLSIIPYRDEDDAIAIANDTKYGLANYVTAGTLAHGQQIAMRLKSGKVHINGAGPDLGAPFGGNKLSGNGSREWGAYGLDEFLSYKSLLGWQPA